MRFWTLEMILVYNDKQKSVTRYRHMVIMIPFYSHLNETHYTGL